MTEEDQLAILCRRMGAPPGQDRLMARKLRQRAEQMAAERSMEKVEALRYLLELISKGGKEDGDPRPAPREDSEPPAEKKNRR